MIDIVSPHIKPRPVLTSERPPSEPGAIGLWVCRDLIFTTKVRETAEALGDRILVASDESLAIALIGMRHSRATGIRDQAL